MTPSTELEPLRASLLEAAAQLDLSLSADQIDKLLGYLSLLQRWNSVYNLTAVRGPAAMLTQHVVDCLAIIRPLQREFGDFPATLLDVGSGGGLPAVVIATLLPRLAVTSVDTVGKKVAFVRQVAGELRLGNLQAEHARVEALCRPGFDIITSRAFATLGDFLRLTVSLAAPNTRWLAMKGKVPQDEIRAVSSQADVFHVEQLAVPGLDAARCIVWMRLAPSGPSL